MSTPNSIEVEVEFVMDSPRPMRHVIARPLQEPIPNFAVTLETTISGCPVEALDLPPRACRPDGSPRLDLLNFRLRTRADCPRFSAVRELPLRGFDLLSMKTWANKADAPNAAMAFWFHSDHDLRGVGDLRRSA